jgi:hypothetical protein
MVTSFMNTAAMRQIRSLPHNPADPAEKQLHIDEYSQGLTFEYARFVNQNTTDYIRMADSKAAILITLLSANVLVLVQRTAESVAQLHNHTTMALLIGGCLYATVSLAVAINTIRPRLYRNTSVGHIFWEDIAAKTKSQYAHGLQHLRVGDIYRELGEHNHNLANTALRKYRWLRVGFLMALTSIVLSAILILFTN